MPMFRSVSCIQVCGRNVISGPNGITEIEISAMVMARNGASR
jgi:hypothetical protein